MMIKQTFKTFKESWKLDKRFLTVALLDILLYAIITPCFLIYALLSNRSALALQELLGTKDLAAYMTSASQFEISMVTGNLRSFVLMFIIGAVILFVAGLLAYTLSRALIWNYLLKEKFSIKKYIKFNCLNLIMLIAIVIMLGIYSLLMLLNRTIFSFILVLLVLGIMYFAFNAKINFTKTGKIFESIGNAFKSMDRNSYLFCLIPFIAVMLITFATSFVLSQLLNTIASMILIIAFSSWMRIFILKTQE